MLCAKTDRKKKQYQTKAVNHRLHIESGLKPNLVTAAVSDNGVDEVSAKNTSVAVRFTCITIPVLYLQR